LELDGTGLGLCPVVDV